MFYTFILKQLFDISVKQLQSSQLITDEDRDFLQNNWDKIISSTPDLITKAQIQKKLSRQQQSSKFCETHSSTSHFPSTPVPEMDLIPISPEDSGDDFTPKRPRTTKGTTVTIPKDILSKLGPTEPGADHHARWMSKSFYILKLSLLQHQIDEIHWQTKKKIHKMALFVVFIYLKAWFNSPSLTSAAKNDLELYKLLLKFKKTHSIISQSACEVLNRHTWYLTEDAITLTLFNEDICTEERTLYAKKIYELAATEELEIQKPDLPLITQKSEISDFIGEQSRLLFDLLNIPLEFLADDEWYLLPEYASVNKSLKHLTPLNDSAERALALATRVNTHITRDEESYQELLQVVEAHREKYGLKTKDDLKKLY